MAAMSSSDDLDRYLERREDEEDEGDYRKTASSARQANSKQSSSSRTTKSEQKPLDSPDPYAFDLDANYGLTNTKSTKHLKRSKSSSSKQSKTPKKEMHKEPTLSLEERMAKILERTGSSTLEEIRKKKQQEKEQMEAEAAVAAAAAAAQAEAQAAAEREKANAKEHNDRADNTKTSMKKSKKDGSASSSDSSDSLGMDSMDFEVGAYAKKRQMERARESKARVSISSINSETFKVDPRVLSDMNTYALDAETHATDMESSKSVVEPPSTTLEETHHVVAGAAVPNTSEATSLVFEDFEKMKALLSLDIPVVHSDTMEGTKDETKEEESPEAFGYESDDFEDEDSPTHQQKSRRPEANAPENETTERVLARTLSLRLQETSEVPPAITQRMEHDERSEYSDEGFERDEAHIFSVLDTCSASTTTGVNSAFIRQKESPATTIDSAQRALETVKSVDITSGSLGSSASIPAPSTYSSANDVGDDDLLMSPPPPPPPDDEDGEDEAQNQKQSDEFSLGESLYQQQRSPAASPILASDSDPVRSAVEPERKQPRMPIEERFQHIQEMVAPLRFVNMPPSHFDQRDQKAVEKRDHDDGEQSTGSRPPTDSVLAVPGAADEQHDDELLVQPRHPTLVELRASVARENELKLQLQIAQRKNLVLQQQIHRLTTSEASAATHEPRSPPHAHATTSVALPSSPKLISKSEYTQLKKEMQTQDMLLQAYQKENEQLMKQVQLIQKETQYDVHLANQELKGQLKKLRGEMEERDHHHASTFPMANTSVEDDESQKDLMVLRQQLHAAVQARLRAETSMLHLEEQLDQEVKRHHSKERELKLELDKLKKAKKEVEMTYEGLTMERLHSDNKAYETLKEQLKTQETTHARQVASLEKKLEWYIENQRLIDEQDELLKKQKLEIETLRNGLTHARSAHKVTKLANSSSSSNKTSLMHRSAADIRRIQQLEAQLVEMEQAMRKRHPDSLVNLILATKAHEDEQNHEENKLQKRLQEMENHVETLQSAHERELQRFRQQHERIVFQYERKLAQQQSSASTGTESMTNPVLQKASARALHDPLKLRVEELEKELKRVRTFYVAKVKEVDRKWQAKCQALVAQKKADNEPDDATVKVALLQQQLRDKDAELKRVKLQQQDARPVEVNDLASSRDHQDHVRYLELQLQASEEARLQLVESLRSVESEHRAETQKPQDAVQPASANQIKAQGNGTEPDGSSASSSSSPSYRALELKTKEMETELRDAKEAFQEELRKIRTQVEAEQQQHQRVDQLKEVQRLQSQLLDSEHANNALRLAVAQVPQLEDEVMRLRKQLRVPNTPSMAAYRSLELKIETLAQKHELREAELQFLLSEATRSSQLEKHRLETAIAAKNAEIEQFRRQLEEILQELEWLKKTATATA